MKLTLMIVGGLVVLVIGFLLINLYVINPRVVKDMLENPDGQRASETMLLTFADGHAIPVNYMEEDGKVFVGADGPWWRKFRGDGAPVTVTIRGEVRSGHATVVLDNQAYVDDIFSRLRPTAPAWLPDWLNGKLVVISFE